MYSTTTTGFERLVRSFFDLFTGQRTVPGTNPFVTILSVVVGILVVLAIIAIIVLIYVMIKIREHHQFIRERDAAALAKRIAEARVVNKKWVKVMADVNSDNEAQWRLSILEADTMLEEFLDSKGYQGVVRGDFLTLDLAWEAHKIRNVIAHEGSDFVMTQREARRVIGLFEKVFAEHKII